MRVAIFDADGTLIDSMQLWNTIVCDYLLSIGLMPEADVDDVIRDMSFADSCKYLIEHYGIDGSVDSLTKEISDMVADKYRYEVPLKAGVKEYLKALKADGVKLCIVTASERSYLQPCLERLGIYDLFDFMLTCSEAGTDKNTPLIYDIAREKTGVSLDATVVFEDALNAVRSAKSGGYKVCAVYDASMAECTEEIKSLCDKYITDFGELTDK
jgi:HAD superfamily hydrolase (TIGR01509 family)